MTNGISTAEKLVKIGLAISKLTIGETRLDAAKEVMTVLTNGRDLHADLTGSERTLAAGLVERAEAHIAAVSGKPDFPVAEMKTAQIHFAQALDHCVPSPETLYALAMKRDPPDLAETMLQAAIAAAPRSDFARACKAEGSLDRRFFLAVTGPFLAELRQDREVFDQLLPALWRELLPAVDRIETKLDDLPDVVAEKLLLKLEQRGEAQAAEAAGVRRTAIIQLAKRISRTIDDWDQAFAELERAVEIAIEVQQEGARRGNLGAFVEEVLARMATLSAEGRFDEAAAEADDAFAEWEQHEEERRQEAMVQGVRLLEAGLKQDLLRGDAASAARRIARRVALETSEAGDLIAALLKEQDDWYVRGRDRGLNLDLEVSIEIARLCSDRAGDDDERGMVQNNLGNALWTLGERESGTERLEEAVAAFRAALEEWTRDRVPLDWATIQNNLGNALATLGERESGTERLEEAVAAFRAALEEWTRDRVPLDWATIQNNLGNALQTLGQRESGTERLEQAVAAYRAALEERTRDRVPLYWATTQNNLGNALATLGERESGTARLVEAVAAFRAALEERTRDRVPLDWAMTQNNLGNALQTHGEREGETDRLEQAVAAYRAALEEWTRDRVPLDWAMAQNNLGNALWTLGERETGTGRLEAAVAACRAALEERTRERVPLDWAKTQNNLATALWALGERERRTDRLEAAVAAYRAALQEWTRDRVPLDWATTQNNLGSALQILGKRESGTERLEQAVAAYRAALEEWTRDRVPLDWALSYGNQGVAMSLLAERTRDPAMAGAAVAQIRTAEQTMRDGGHAPFADFFRARLPEAEAIVARLQGGAAE